MTIWTKRSPPISPPDAAAADVFGWSGPIARPPFGARIRRFCRRHSFKLSVLLPTLLAATYFLAFAAPQYQSEARFLVRGRQAAPTTGGIGEMLQGAGFSRGSDDAMGIRDYLQSHAAVAELRRNPNLVAIYRRPEADPVAKLWWSDPSAERLLDYFQRMVTADLDSSSGITTLKVRSFRPADSRDVAENLLRLSETLVNRLNLRMQDDSLRVARDDLTRAEARVAAAHAAVTDFRQREQALDPGRAAAVTIENLGKLEGALAQARAEMAEARRYARGDNPLIVQIRNRISGLEQQVAEERQRTAGGEANSSKQVSEYERLELERELARGQLASATASLERARVDAQRQQIFLLRVVEPNLAEWPRYPRATVNTIYVLLCLSVGYGLAWLLIAGMREHAS